MPKIQLDYEGKIGAADVKPCFKELESKLATFKLPTKQYSCNQSQRESSDGKSKGTVNIASLVDLKLGPQQVAELQKIVKKYAK